MDTFNDCFPFGETELSRAIRKAEAMSDDGQLNLHVVRTASGLEIMSDYSAIMRKDEIIETVYTTDSGFELIQTAA